jgi:hypothetical protein
LVTDRYIDEDASFFEDVDVTLGWCTAANGELDLWPRSGPSTGAKWVVANEEAFKARLVDLKKMVEAARAKLMSRP